MAVLNNAETNYPAELDQYVEERDSQTAGRTLARSAPIMGALKAIRAIEQELGYGSTTPKGDDSSLAVRLAKRLFEIRMHKSGGFSTLEEALKNGTSTYKPGMIGIEPKTDGTASETVTDTPISIGSKQTIIGALGASKIEQNKSVTASRPILKNEDQSLGNSLQAIEGLELDGNADASTGTEWDHGIDWRLVTRGILAGCYIHDPGGDGVYISDGQQYIIRNLWIKVPRVSSSPLVGRNGIAIVDGKKVIIEGCFIMGGDPACIDLEPNTGNDIDEVIIRDNIVTGLDELGNQIASNGYGILINQSNGHIRRLVIEGNVILETGYDGIALLGYANESSSDELSDVAIANNVLYNVNKSSGGREGGISVANQLRRVGIVNNILYKAGKYGLFIYQHDGGASPAKEGKGLIIVGNQVYNAGHHGLFVYSDTSDNHGEAWIIANNIAANNGQTTANSAGFKLNYLRKVIVEGNIAYDDQASPTQTYGFQLYNCQRVLFSPSNVAHGNTYNVNTSGTNDIRDGSIRAYHYIATSITADDTNKTMYPHRDITVQRDWKVGMGGYLIGIRAVIQDATTGNISVYPTINGTVKSGIGVTLNTGNTSAAQDDLGKQGNSSYELSAGDTVGAVYNAESSGTFSAPVVAEVLVKHTI